MAIEHPAHNSAALSFTDPGLDLVHPMFQLPDSADEMICLRSAASEPCTSGLNAPVPQAQATRFYVRTSLLQRHSHVFSDMLARKDGTAVFQVAEDAITLEYLLRSIQEDLNDYPDLLELDLDGLNKLYKAAFKYGIVSVQTLAEHCIRLRMQITVLRTPTFHEKLAAILVTAWTFKRLVLYKEAAAIVANMRKSLRERVVETLSANIDIKGVNLFMEELAKVEREKKKQIWSGITISTETVEAFDVSSDIEEDASEEIVRLPQIQVA